MEEIFGAYKVEQINNYLFVDTYKSDKIKKWREWNDGE